MDFANLASKLLKQSDIRQELSVIQSRRPNNRIDKVRHMFNKKEN